MSAPTSAQPTDPNGVLIRVEMTITVGRAMDLAEWCDIDELALACREALSREGLDR